MPMDTAKKTSAAVVPTVGIITYQDSRIPVVSGVS